jgi:hypothetical protein
VGKQWKIVIEFLFREAINHVEQNIPNHTSLPVLEQQASLEPLPDTSEADRKPCRPIFPLSASAGL